MNRSWNARNGDYNWLNFSIPTNTKNGQGKTAQDRMYGQSGWEALTRGIPFQRNLGDFCYAWPVITLRHELLQVAPSGDQNPSRELDTAPIAITRSDLNVVWGTLTFQPEQASDYLASIESLPGNTVTYPAPILLRAKVQKTDPIAKAGIDASYSAPDGTQGSLSMKDDGIAPDWQANDGIYSAIYAYRQSGNYSFSVTFNNDASTAEFTQLAALHSIGPNGETYSPTSNPVGEAFRQTATVTVTINGFLADDHGDLPSTSTVLSTDNVGVAGTIDRAGDVDVFLVDPANADPIAVRVTNLGLGMLPNVRVLESDGVTLVKEYRFTPGDRGYFSYIASATNGDPFYVVVSHQSVNADQGVYKISSGQILPSGGDTDFRVFLPIATR